MNKFVLISTVIILAAIASESYAANLTCTVYKRTFSSNGPGSFLPPEVGDSIEVATDGSNLVGLSDLIFQSPEQRHHHIEMRAPFQRAAGHLADFWLHSQSSNGAERAMVYLVNRRSMQIRVIQGWAFSEYLLQCK